MDRKPLPLWQHQDRPQPHKNLCLISVVFAFSIGLLVGIFIPLMCIQTLEKTDAKPNTINNDIIKSVFVNNSYSSTLNSTKPTQQTQDFNEYPTVSFVETREKTKNTVMSDSLVEDGIYWARAIEDNLPQGYTKPQHIQWSEYVKKSVGVKLENGCGRMQNRLVTFEDGVQACVRYRQNTDQIQGELFSFYLAQLLQLNNLAPSTISIVNLNDQTWKNLGGEISSAQWNSNRPVVLTKYINNLEAANIPQVFKPEERHLNRNDVLNMTNTKNLIELAQWSDLIIFDYLTANLDRIVNNLYNYQWNVNIMDAPAHNLARKLDSNLLVFLDNESGLLHGYRLLKKYEVYHSILLDNLCVFRRPTVEVIKRLKRDGNVGALLRTMFERANGPRVRDVLPTLPDKSVKILNERIDKVYNQILKCQAVFTEQYPT